jgi:hypothetical protein
LQLQLKKHQEMVQKSWDADRVDKEARKERAKGEEEQRLRREASTSAENERVVFENEERKKKKIMEWKKTLLAQIEAVRGKERSEAAMKEEVRHQLEKEKKIEEVEAKRKKMEERRRNADLG